MNKSKIRIFVDKYQATRLIRRPRFLPIDKMIESCTFQTNKIVKI